MADRPDRYQIRKRKDLPKYMWKLTKHKARREGHPFDLEVSDIQIPDRCPVLGIPIDPFGEDRRLWPTVDRLFADLGYVKGNVSIISFRANNLKSNATLDELKAILRWMKGRINASR